MNNQQRSRELEILARENNWSFSLTADVSAIQALGKFEFHTGEKRQAERLENLIKGNNFMVFDVYWKSGFDPLDAAAAITYKDTSARLINRQTLVYKESTDFHFPKFQVYPADALSPIDRWLDKTFRRIGFPHHPEFEKRWSVRGDSQKIAGLFSEKVIEFYEGKADFWTFAVDNCLFIYQPDVLTPPEQILNWIKELFELSDIFGEQG